MSSSLSDELSPGISRHPTDRFAIIMPMRVNIPPAITREPGASAQYNAQAAAKNKTPTTSPEFLAGTPGQTSIFPCG